MSFRTVVAHLLYTQTRAHNTPLYKERKGNKQKQKGLSRLRPSSSTSAALFFANGSLYTITPSFIVALKLYPDDAHSTDGCRPSSLLVKEMRGKERSTRVSTSFSHPHCGGFKILIAKASSEASRRWMRGEVTCFKPI